MTNSIYNHSSGQPVSLSRGTSAVLRAEFDALASAFDLVSSQIMGVAIESGSGNAFVLALSPNPSNQPSRGTFLFQATHSNTGAATLQLGTLTPLPLLNNDGTPLSSGAVTAGSIIMCYTNGTNFYLMSATKAYVDGAVFSSVLPGQAGNAGKYIQTNGTTASWQPLAFGAGSVISPAITVTDSGTGFYRPALNQIALAVNGAIAELNQATGKTLYGNLVFGTGLTFPANMTTAQLLALTGAPKADGTGASGTWGISISGNAATATSATNATNATNATIAADTATNATFYVPYVSATTGNVALRGTRLTVNPSTGDFTSSGNVSAYSDERKKKKWAKLVPDFITRLAKVKSGTYERKDIKGLRQAGVSAQSLRDVLPEAVLEGEDGFLSVAYGNAALVAAVELAKEVQVLRARIEKLESRK